MTMYRMTGIRFFDPGDKADEEGVSGITWAGVLIVGGIASIVLGFVVDSLRR